jgi:predicted metalloprotease
LGKKPAWQVHARRL